MADAKEKNKETKPEQTSEASKQKARLKKGVICAAVLAVVAIVLGAVLSSVGYRGTVKKIAKAYRTGQPDQLYAMTWFPDAEEEAEDGAFTRSSCESSVNGIHKAFSDYFGGKKYHIRYRITKHTEMNEKRLADINESFQIGFDGNVPTIEKVLDVEVKFTARRFFKKTSATETFTLLKVNGEWMLKDPAWDSYYFE